MRKRKKIKFFQSWVYQEAPLPTPDQLQTAYRRWVVHYPFCEVDWDLRPFLTVPKREPWLRHSRNALFLSMETVAKNLGISKAAYAKMEKSECDQTIKLSTLARAAGAMDCELVYAIRPKSKQRFSEIIWNKLVQKAKDYVHVRNSEGGRKIWHVASHALRLMQDTHFRQDMGWVEKRPNRRSRGR